MIDQTQVGPDRSVDGPGAETVTPSTTQVPATHERVAPRPEPPHHRRRLVLALATGAAVFAVNNVLLARLLTSLPGGTVLAATNMAALAILVPRFRAFGAVTLVYIAYGTLGTLGHLGVDAGAYVLHLPRVLGAALAFDLVLLLGGFKRRALGLGVLPFAGILLLGGSLSPREWLTAMLLAYAGLAAGTLFDGLLRRGRS